MHLINVLKRIASNLIDILLFLSGFIVLKLLSSENKSSEEAFYLIFASYILLFVPPLLTHGNIIGKLVMNLTYKSSKSKIFLKYSIYLLAFFPGFSIISTITDFPYFQASNYNIAISIQLLITLSLLNLIVFLLSAGKYHILDYLLNIQICGLEFNKKPLKSLTIALLFWSILVFTNLAFLKKDISVERVFNSLSKEVYNENFPEDLFYGNKIFVVRRKYDGVFIPSDMFSFLFRKEYDQKLLFLTVPFEVFNSKEDRFAICKELLLQSGYNDIFAGYKPKQTRITLRTFKDGDFLEYYSYSYTYYFNEDNGVWGIYGGIKNDSTMIDSYSSFVVNIPRNKTRTVNFESTIYTNKYIIKHENAELNFEVIPFEVAPMKGSMQMNFPPQNIIYRGNYWNVVDGSEITDMDDDYYYLKFCRDEISSKYL